MMYDVRFSDDRLNRISFKNNDLGYVRRNVEQFMDMVDDNWVDNHDYSYTFRLKDGRTITAHVGYVDD